MSNQLRNKASALADILAAHHLTKVATGQDIEHKTLKSQTNLGAEQTQEIRDGLFNVTADTEAAANISHDRVQEEPAGIQSLNKSPEAALAASGTSVENVTTNGDPSAEPGALTQSKAAAYQMKLANILAMSKQANTIMTGTEVMAKIASLTETSPVEAFADARESLIKLASTNPLFNVCRERIMMEKMAADIAELAQNEGISPEEAAAELDAAQEANPEMAQELEDEADGEAVEDLANVEQTAADLGPGIEQMAANASEALGTEITPEDIMQSADDVVAQAEELGVEPEELIQAAIDELQGGEGGEEDVSEEDMANAEQILEAAAEQGISPEEVIQMAAEEMGGEGAPEEAAPMEDKQASYNGGYMSKRAAYCAFVRNNY